jgi:selenocysteine lyase/cysteine desulfurase
VTRLNRRQLLVRGGVAVGAGAAAAVGAGVAARELTAESPPDVSSWDGVRARFELDPEVVQMTAFLLAPHPQPVREAIERHRAGLDRDPKTYLFEHERRLEEAVASAAADYLGTSSEELAFTDSTTMGLGLVYSTIRLREGDEIVTTQHDHYATHESLRLRVARTPGVSMRKVSLYDDGEPLSEDQVVARLRAAIGPRTRLVALTWVHSSTGVKLPIRAVADMLAEVDAARPLLLAVDGVHALGVEKARMSELGCDLFFAGCHKWLFGPRGTGLVWARPEAWREVTPVIPTFDGRSYFAWIQGREPDDLPPGPAMTPGGFHSFEHRWALAEAFGFHGEIGPERVTERTHELAAQLKDGLAGIRRVRLITPRAADLSAGIVCFEVDGVPATEVVDRLEERGVVASVTPYATEYVRMGPSIANSPADVDSALRTLRSFL